MSDSAQIVLTQETDFRLGDIEVRPRSRELIAAAGVEVLEPRIMQVLVALARSRGKLVSRDELTAACWGGRIVGDDAIYRCIQAIRKRARVHGGFEVTTVARVGYRLDVTQPLSSRSAPPTLAVLAFDNLSGDPDMAWFSDGVSVEILHAVTRGADIAVIGRASSFQFRGAAKAARNVGASLKATHVLDGTIRRWDSRVRVSVELVECADESLIWSQTFERDLYDLFDIQDEIAAAVAEALTLTFTRANRAEPIDPAVYDIYLRTRDPLGGFVSASDEQKQVEAIQLLEQVTRCAPGFARAWADLALRQAHHLRHFGRARLSTMSTTTVMEVAQTALRLDPELGIAHQALSMLLPFSAYREREVLHQRALAASPKDSEVLNLAGQFYAEVGRLRETFELARQAVALNPLYWPAAQWHTGLLGAMGRYSEARPLWDAYIARWPDVEALLGEAMAAAANASDWDRFEALAEHGRQHGFDNPHYNDFIRYQRNRRNPRPAYIEALRTSVRNGLERDGRVSLRDLARLHALGRVDEAFDVAERACFAYVVDAAGTQPAGPWAPGILFVPQNPMMATDPRFVLLCARLGLVEYWVGTERWPDCADPGVLPYDFKAECRRIAGG